MSFMRKLVENNTGVSSKSFFLVLVTVIGSILLVIVGFILVFEIIKSGTIRTDLQGLAMFVGSITTLFGAAGLTKCLGERSEHKKE